MSACQPRFIDFVLYGIIRGTFHMVDLFSTLGAILLLGIVAKPVEEFVFGWQTKHKRDS